MNFYDFLWEAVRRPTLIIEYAKEVGLKPPPPPEDFYDRLEYVARISVLLLEAERGDDQFWRRRCAEAKRFYLEVAADLKEVGRNLPSFTQC